MQIWKEVGCLYLAPAGGPKPFAFCAIKIKIQPLQKHPNQNIFAFPSANEIFSQTWRNDTKDRKTTRKRRFYTKSI